ncbi:PD-(D/E)XK nuclease family protein [Myxococcota bacterium]|nr:PD-(D/E)XK nuclease family protein [Myxococcota bacterium]
MGPIFSHSRISSFENCPKQFEFRYVQKIESESESIEAFVGKRVHEVLERLYQFAGRGQLPGVEKVVDRYHKLWEEAYDGDRVRIVREGASLGFYRALGERCVRGYYLRHYPFDDGETLGLEKRVVFPLDDAGSYRMQGIVDRISRARDGAIEVHDYKTGARVPSQRALDEDRQLALYQIGLARELGEDRPFRLVWHYVAKDVTRISTRTPESLEALRRSTIARIDEIQSASAYPTRKSALCGWCEYRTICPAFEAERAPATAGGTTDPQLAPSAASSSPIAASSPPVLEPPGNAGAAAPAADSAAPTASTATAATAASLTRSPPPSAIRWW